MIATYLSARDPRLAGIIKSATLPPLPVPLTPYLTLLQSVVSQQLSWQTAQTIWQKLLVQLGSELPPTVILTQAAALRAIGLSRPKVGYLQAVARHALQHDLTVAALAPLAEQVILEQLTAIHGIGCWSVQMLLMFCLQRPDVFSVDDLVIRQAMQQLYGLEEQRGSGLKRQLQQIAAQWAPHRSTACRYLWAWRGS